MDKFFAALAQFCYTLDSHHLACGGSGTYVAFPDSGRFIAAGGSGDSPLVAHLYSAWAGSCGRYCCVGRDVSAWYTHQT